MNRRTFIGAASSALIAAGTTHANAKEQTENQGTSSLKVRFLGTGAADWNGKDDRGEHRRLSSILLDNSILIDYTRQARDMIPEGVNPQVIFYTHSHGDHYNPGDALELGIKEVYLSQTWYDIAMYEFKKAANSLDVPMPKLHPLCIGQEIVLGQVRVTPLPANHATSHILEQSLLYLIEKGTARVLYATDTGGIPGVAARLAGIDAHTQGLPISGLIMEATMGLEHEADFRLFTHSSVKTVQQTVEVLTMTNRYIPQEGQKVWLTHMARTLHGTQAELDEKLPSPLRAAYDGLEVTFN